MPSRSSKKQPVEVIAETPEYLVVNKPAGLIVHPATREQTGDSLVEILVARYPEIEHVGETKPWYRPGIVHRLDRDASGVLVVSRTPEMYKHLRKQFEDKKIEKHYTVLVEGMLEESEGTIEIPIARDPDKKRMVTPGESDDSTLTWLPAITHWKKIEEFPNATLLEVRTETGRTQQIRVHFSAIGHPIVGDHLYNVSDKMKHKVRNPSPFVHTRTGAGLNRIFLHATRLQFTDLTGTPQTFETPLPPELEHYFTSLK